MFLFCFVFYLPCVKKQKAENKVASVGGTNIRLGCCHKTARGALEDSDRAPYDITVSCFSITNCVSKLLETYVCYIL